MFLEMKGISPSKLFQDAIFNLKSNIQNKPAVCEVEKDISILRKYFVAGTKPNGDRELYLKAVNMFLEKYPDWTKAEVMARAERPIHVNLKESKEETVGGESDGC